VGERFGADLQELLQIREAQLREAMALANCGAFEWDVVANIVIWSPELRRILGVAPDHPASVDNFMALVHPEDRGWAMKVRDESLHTGRTREQPFRVIRPDGSVRIVKGRSIASNYKDGQPTYMVGVIQEVAWTDPGPGFTREREALEHITEREHQVLMMVVQGITSKGVAGVLGLSPKTVETYRCRLMAKLGVEDVAGLVRFCIRHGVTPP
jgi:PAS domain S-box-containing protein